MYFLWDVVWWGSLGVPSRLLYVRSSEGHAGFVVCGSSLRHGARVRVFQCTVMLVWSGTGARHSGPFRARSVVCRGPASVVIFHCPAVLVFCSQSFYPLVRGL